MTINCHGTMSVKIAENCHIVWGRDAIEHGDVFGEIYQFSDGTKYLKKNIDT